MFVGHYGPSFAVKAARASIPLWVVFIAVQLIDVLWAIFVLLGIEKVRIVPGFTATNPLDLYYMPYTHSLIGATVWAIAAGIVYYLFRKVDGWSAAAIVGAAVFLSLGARLACASPRFAVVRQFPQGWSGTLEFPGVCLSA
jgi:hypothetical protein